MPVPYPLHESRGWRPDIDEMRRLDHAEDAAIYVNSPNNPTGGVLTRGDLDAIAALARERNLWVISDEAYEDVVFDGEHISIASLPGHVRADDSALHVQQDLRDYRPAARLHRRQGSRRFANACGRCSSTPCRTRRRSIQYGGVGALAGSQDVRRRVPHGAGGPARSVLRGVRERGATASSAATPPAGAFYAFLKIDPAWRSPLPDAPESQSWAMTEFLIKKGRIGCVPGVDFGAHGRRPRAVLLRARRAEINGALESDEESVLLHDVTREELKD